MFNRWGLYMIAVGFVSGIGTLFLYIVASKVFTMVIYTIGLYLEPVFSALIVWIIGIENLPCKKFLPSPLSNYFLSLKHHDNWPGLAPPRFNPHRDFREKTQKPGN